MPADNKEADPAETAPEVADPRRREALRKLGRTAVYAAPAAVSLMMMNRAAAAPS